MTSIKYDYQGQKQMLTIATVAFFISVMVWFNMAPFQASIQDQLSLTKDEIGALMIVNLALSIPGRIIFGRLVDRYGPKKVFSIFLIIMSMPCFLFAIGTTYIQLLISRLILGTIGASFVIGIRMVSEWYPNHQSGLAQGIYAGWGNFGSSFAALTLPSLALFFGGDNGWRYAIFITGVFALIYGLFFYFKAKDTPDWKTFHYTKTANPMKATSSTDLVFLMLLNFPVYGGFAILIWTLENTSVLPSNLAKILYGGIAVFYIFNMRKRWKANQVYLQKKIPSKEKFSMKNVAILSLGYFSTFGSELAIISMLPMFFQETFAISTVFAAAIASSFAFTNLIARPAGGWLSDRFGRKKITLLLLAVLTCLYLLMALVNSNWPIFLALLITVCCSLVSQAASGAIFSMVSHVKQNQTGQIAGMVGAYGNIGSLCFLAVLNLFFPSMFFIAISFVLLVCFCSTTQLHLQNKTSSLKNPINAKAF
ncbi:MFS transporter [Gracilibacillus salinarum]|uniref:MFS transporter n=1 Tax=Gracilibacillus salinarum TaxID=2932255 RepID=A0ABY4GMB2_9BACI|nr:MFS transporter [Gracilibacillus salinarum]UOQ85374.1 MFS transporter [Gracilibacillus salinarum]